MDWRSDILKNSCTCTAKFHASIKDPPQITLQQHYTYFVQKYNECKLSRHCMQPHGKHGLAIKYYCGST